VWAVEPLIRALRDPDWGVREKVAVALGSIGDARALPALSRLLGDRDSVVRAAGEAAESIRQRIANE